MKERQELSFYLIKPRDDWNTEIPFPDIADRHRLNQVMELNRFNSLYEAETPEQEEVLATCVSKHRKIELFVDTNIGYGNAEKLGDKERDLTPQNPDETRSRREVVYKPGNPPLLEVYDRKGIEDTWRYTLELDDEGVYAIGSFPRKGSLTTFTAEIFLAVRDGDGDINEEVPIPPKPEPVFV